MAERAVIYMRKSVDDPDSYSFEFQEDDCRAFANEQRYQVIEVVQESGISGHDSLDERNVLKLVRKMIRAKSVDVLLIWKYDRLARDFLDQAFVIREAKMSGVRVEAATEPVPEGPLGWIMQAIHGGMSEQEWHKIKERLRSGVDRRVSAGNYLTGRKAPLGYMFADAKKTRLLPDPATAPLVIRIFDLVSSGVSCHEVARTLNDEGIPTPMGKSFWSHSVIRRLVINQLYIGIVVAFQTAVVTEQVPFGIGGEIRKKRRLKPGRKVVLPEGTAPPLVSRETFDRARSYLNQRRITPLGKVKSANSQLLLRGGFVRCAICGRSMSVMTPSNALGYKVSYACAKARQKALHGNAVVAETLDAFVWATFVEAVSKPGVVDEAVRLLEGRREEETLSQLVILNQLLHENQEATEGIVGTAKFAKTEDAQARLGKQLDDLAVEESRLQQRIALLRQKDLVITAARKTLDKFASLSQVELDRLNLTERRRLLFDCGVLVFVKSAGGKRGVPMTIRADVEVAVLSPRSVYDSTEKPSRSSDVAATIRSPDSVNITILLRFCQGAWTAELRVA